MYGENPKQFNKTYRIQIAHTEQEKDTIIWMSVFCGDKTGFVRPGHILYYIIYIHTHTCTWLCMHFFNCREQLLYSNPNYVAAYSYVYL